MEAWFELKKQPEPDTQTSPPNPPPYKSLPRADGGSGCQEVHGESRVDALALKWRLPIALAHIGLGASRGTGRNCQHRHPSTLKRMECTGRPMTIEFLFRLINGSTHGEPPNRHYQTSVLGISWPVAFSKFTCSCRC